MTLRFYDPSAVNIVIGASIISGFAEGSFLTVSKTEDDYTTTNGTDGLVARNAIIDKRAQLTIRLLQTSDSNGYLLSLRNLGIPVAMQVKDQVGNTQMSAANVWVRKVTDVDFDREATGREWVLETDNLEYVSL